jgi:hypothetical protein
LAGRLSESRALLRRASDWEPLLLVAWVMRETLEKNRVTGVF